MKNLSVSKIESYLTCPYNFKLAYVDRIPQVSSGTPLVGRVIHDIVEVSLKEYGRTGKYPDPKTMDDRFLPTYQRLVAKEESRDTFVGWQWDMDMSEADAKAAYRALIPVAHEALEKYRPMMLETGPAVEQRIDLEFDSEVGPIPLIGYVDLLDESELLCDWKSTLKSEPSKMALKSWLQFACYSFWSWPLIGDEEQQCRKIFLVAGGTPHVEVEPFVVGPKHREYFAKLAAQVWKGIYYNVFPATDSWKCDPRFCSFFGPCKSEVMKIMPEQKCAGCAKTLYSGSKFCMYCGLEVKVETAVEIAAEVAAQATVEESW